jgi:HD-GYP domain-containing protein (c-di-GMP phosphodiesterase class II)
MWSSLGEHCERMAVLAGRIGEELGLWPDQLEIVRLGSFLHDIGKIAIPDRILLERGPLSAEETALMRTHPLIGDRLLAPFPALQAARPVVRWHHERWDGDGYPDGLAGEQVPLAARIVAVADALEAMSADRVYRPRLSLDEIVTELENGCGRQWDPVVAQIALDLVVAGELRLGVAETAPAAHAAVAAV